MAAVQKKAVILLLIISTPFLYGFIGQEYNKATKKDDIILISSEKEKAIGASIVKQVEKQFEPTDDPLVEKKVQEIGAKLASVCERQDISYQFQVIKSPQENEYNAFAVPGGYIYIFDKFVIDMKNDNEIAAVLAHELGHIAAKHSIQKLQAGMGMNALLVLSAGLSGNGNTVAQTADAVTQLMASYSREAEIEADELSVRYLKNAGYDPNGVVESLEFLRNYRKKGPLMGYIYYRSHPYISERIARAKAEIRGHMDFDSFINIPVRTEDF